MIALGLGSINILELLVVFLLSAAVQLAILFIVVYAAVRVALRNSPTDLIDQFTAWFDRAQARTSRLVRRLRSAE